MDAQEKIIASLETFFRQNAARFGIEMAFLYGSWASGSPRGDSDIDIAVVFSQELSSDEELFEYVTDISLFLSRELLSEVSVIPISWNFDKPMLYYNAIVSGIPVFFKEFTKYVDLRNEAIFQMEDFSIFGREWQLRITRNNLEELTRA